MVYLFRFIYFCVCSFITCTSVSSNRTWLLIKVEAFKLCSFSWWFCIHSRTCLLEFTRVCKIKGLTERRSSTILDSLVPTSILSLAWIAVGRWWWHSSAFNLFSLWLFIKQSSLISKIRLLFLALVIFEIAVTRWMSCKSRCDWPLLLYLLLPCIWLWAQTIISNSALLLNLSLISFSSVRQYLFRHWWCDWS